MKRPSFQFYPGDWTGNSNLRRCTHAEKGVWLEVLCLMHDQAEYGVLRWPLKEIIEAVKCKPADVKALVSKGVLKGSDTQLEEQFIYTPRSGRKDGTPVVLMAHQPGPVWYSSRMVKDEYVRTIRGEGTRFGEESDAAPKPPFGDGPSSSSSSSPSGLKTGTDVPVGPRPPAKADLQALIDGVPKLGYTVPPCPHKDILALWQEVLPALPQHTVWTQKREKHLQSRWRETAVEKQWADQERGLRYFRRLFEHVGKSQFLTGKAPTTNGRTPFVIELEWLINPSNWAKVIEGKYHPEQEI